MEIFLYKLWELLLNWLWCDAVLNIIVYEPQHIKVYCDASSADC